MRQECQRSANDADGSSADQAVLCGFARVRMLRRDESDDQAAGDHAGDPGGMVVAFSVASLRDSHTCPVEVNACNLGSIETEAYAFGIAGRVAVQVSVGHAAKEAMDGAVVSCGDDEGLSRSESAEAVPRRIGRCGGRFRQDLGLHHLGQQQQSDEYNRNAFHDSRC